MSITNYYQVDALGINNNNDKDLILLIQDDLKWNIENEKEHLEHLQNKINAYVKFLNAKQYKDAYPEMDFNEFTIDVHMHEHPTDLGVKFLDLVNRDLEEKNIKVIVAIESNSEPSG